MPHLELAAATSSFVTRRETRMRFENPVGRPAPPGKAGGEKAAPEGGDGHVPGRRDLKGTLNLNATSEAVLVLTSAVIESVKVTEDHRPPTYQKMSEDKSNWVPGSRTAHISSSLKHSEIPFKPSVARPFEALEICRDHCIVQGIVSTAMEKRIVISESIYPRVEAWSGEEREREVGGAIGTVARVVECCRGESPPDPDPGIQD